MIFDNTEPAVTTASARVSSESLSGEECASELRGCWQHPGLGLPAGCGLEAALSSQLMASGGHSSSLDTRGSSTWPLASSQPQEASAGKKEVATVHDADSSQPITFALFCCLGASPKSCPYSGEGVPRGNYQEEGCVLRPCALSVPSRMPRLCFTWTDSAVWYLC